MGSSTGIAWTDATFNPWIGCTKISPGCDLCYAEQEDKRRKWGGATHWGVGTPRYRTSARYWQQPHHWDKQAFVDGLPHRVFCASLADVFDNEAPDEWRADLWKLIEATPSLTWQLVTKRIGNVRYMVPEHWREKGFPANVWTIATVVNQDEFDRDFEKLAGLPCKVNGLSIEPMLGPIKLSQYSDAVGNLALSWVIYGGESSQGGTPARPCRREWIEDGIEQCRRLGIAPFVKQLGSNHVRETIHKDYGQFKFKQRAGADPEEWPAHLRVREFPA